MASEDPFVILLSIVIWGGIIGFVIHSTVKDKEKARIIPRQKNEMEDKINSISGFTTSQVLVCNNGKTSIALDDKDKKAVLLRHNGSSIEIKLLPYTDILASEVIEDSDIVTKTERGSQLGGAILGGLALGGVGAIIGGLSGKTRATKKVKKIELRVTVNDINKPTHYINLMDEVDEKDKKDKVYQTAIEIAQHWHTVLSIVINNKNNMKTEQQVVSGSNSENKNIFCSNCGEKLTNVVNFCSGCGYKIT